MPTKQVFRPKSLKTLCFETVVLIGLATVVGHVGMSLWDRYIIQRDFDHLKWSLYKLKETVNGIGNAYDNLNVELKNLSVITDNHLDLLGKNVNRWNVTVYRNKEKIQNSLQSNKFYRRNIQQPYKSPVNDKNYKTVLSKNAAVTVKPLTCSIGVDSGKNKANGNGKEYCYGRFGYNNVGKTNYWKF